MCDNCNWISLTRRNCFGELFILKYAYKLPLTFSLSFALAISIDKKKGPVIIDSNIFTFSVCEIYIEGSDLLIYFN